VEAFEQDLSMDSMRCHISPNLLAVWREKKTGMHLSGFAAVALVKGGKIHPSDLRL
jgi:sterol 3beta-glucosyltransferase